MSVLYKLVLRLSESDRMVVFRLGKMQGVRGPGNFFLNAIPLIQNIFSEVFSFSGFFCFGKYIFFLIQVVSSFSLGWTNTRGSIYRYVSI